MALRLEMNLNLEECPTEQWEAYCCCQQNNRHSEMRKRSHRLPGEGQPYELERATVPCCNSIVWQEKEALAVVRRTNRVAQTSVLPHSTATLPPFSRSGKCCMEKRWFRLKPFQQNYKACLSGKPWFLIKRVCVSLSFFLFHHPIISVVSHHERHTAKLLQVLRSGSNSTL